MSIYLFGPLIKQRREELGYTQEDLADGICSVPTLSRIENGERIPTKQHSEMLLQRLGYSDSFQAKQLFMTISLMHASFWNSMSDWQIGKTVFRSNSFCYIRQSCLLH